MLLGTLSVCFSKVASKISKFNGIKNDQNQKHGVIAGGTAFSSSLPRSLTRITSNQILDIQFCLASASWKTWTNTRLTYYEIESAPWSCLNSHLHCPATSSLPTQILPILWTQCQSHLLHEVFPASPCSRGSWTRPRAPSSTHFCRSSVVSCFKDIEQTFSSPNTWG